VSHDVNDRTNTQKLKEKTIFDIFEN